MSLIALLILASLGIVVVVVVVSMVLLLARSSQRGARPEEITRLWAEIASLRDEVERLKTRFPSTNATDPNADKIKEL